MIYALVAIGDDPERTCGSGNVLTHRDTYTSQPEIEGKYGAWSRQFKRDQRREKHSPYRCRASARPGPNGLQTVYRIQAPV